MDGIELKPEREWRGVVLDLLSGGVFHFVLSFLGNRLLYMLLAVFQIGTVASIGTYQGLAGEAPESDGHSLTYMSTARRTMDLCLPYDPASNKRDLGTDLHTVFRAYALLYVLYTVIVHALLIFRIMSHWTILKKPEYSILSKVGCSMTCNQDYAFYSIQLAV